MQPKNNIFSLKEAQIKMASILRGCRLEERIQRFEIPVYPVDILLWLSLQKNDVKIYGSDKNNAMVMAGIGETLCIKGQRLGSYKKVLTTLRLFLSSRYPYLQWYGGFCFDDRYLDKQWSDFGAYRFIIPRFELAARGGKMIFCCNLAEGDKISSVLKELRKLVVDDVILRQYISGNYVSKGPIASTSSDCVIARRVFHRRSNLLKDCFASLAMTRDERITARSDKPQREKWEQRVNKILSDASIKKAVLARRTTLVFKKAPDPWMLLRNLKEVTPNSYHYAFQFKGNIFLGASPERLYFRQERLVDSEALAGTSPISSGVMALKASDKNKREHAIVVDALKASFKKCCVSFKYDKRPHILSLSNGHHFITHFKGQLKRTVGDEDLLKSLHPTPALGGLPRQRALWLIHDLEGFSRGWYGGPMGYVAQNKTEFVVGIRSGLLEGTKLHLFAGAGIVQGSKASDEWDEVENKISNFIKII
ncbi:MAG: isochorismate synthase [Candidatus Omnitrophica bacterium]|nr:isochorismate synthase [Candidatus Omnitrophota bacterium]